ncbi:TRAFAC clade GTPase domain-containing protein [Streptomyces sp. URMC 126]|uniref:TRAFAC clade GTPase domain-containing protein n=1 Tax=Streptomyces sp. URMC 126 TaxID=3423401 RepID=UPI003F1D9726
MRTPWRRAWVCPRCFRTLTRGRITYVCAGRPACPDDRALASADPRAGSAVCGTCGRTTTRLRCAACDGRLPEGYLRTPGRLVALAGPVGSGKSTYLGVLTHELLHRLGAELDAALLPCDDTTILDHHERYARHLYEERHTVPKTAEDDAGRPLVHRLRRVGRGRFGRARERALTLVLLDTAGEHFSSRERMEARLPHLAAADAVVVLVDPGDLPGAPVRGGGVPGRSGEVLARVLDHLGGGGKVTVPVAVVLTKADLLWPHLPEHSPLHHARRPGPLFDADDRAAVHAELRALLRRWQEDRLDALPARFCADYQLFAVSTLGAAPRRDGGLGLGGVVCPHRVEDPLMWLLYRFGVLDRERG